MSNDTDPTQPRLIENATPGHINQDTFEAMGAMFLAGVAAGVGMTASLIAADLITATSIIWPVSMGVATAAIGWVMAFRHLPDERSILKRHVEALNDDEE